MTEVQFFQRLRSTPRDWRLEPTMIDNTKMFLIRRKTNKREQCPISCLAKLPVWLVYDSIEQLHLSRKLGKRIIAAADAEPQHDRNLRGKLLDACGLKER